MKIRSAIFARLSGTLSARLIIFNRLETGIFVVNMKKNKLLNASFEECLNLQDDSLVQYMEKDVNKAELPTGKKYVKSRILGCIFLCMLLGLTYIPPIMAVKGSAGEFEAMAIPVPEINLLPYWAFWLLFIVWTIFVFLFRDRGENYLTRYRGQLNINAWAILMLVEVDLLFSTFAASIITYWGVLLVNLLFLFTALTLTRSKMKALKNLIFDTFEKNDKVDHFIKKSLKYFLSFGSCFIVGYMLWKIISPGSLELGTGMLGFIGVILIWIVFTIGVLVFEIFLVFPYVLQGYYKHKYSEKYRNWEDKTPEEWYGQKYLKKQLKRRTENE